MLYIGMGDGGSAGDPRKNAQNLGSLLGKLLRIDVTSKPEDGQKYVIPKDNPFVKTNGAKPEIWAYGLRNPYEFAFDRATGDLWISDVGQNHWEEINWQPANSKGGENYGWKHNQGSKCHPMTGPNDKCPIVGVLPVAEYPHQEPYPGAQKLKDDWGCSVQGFGVANYGGMNGVYVTGDWCSGRVFGTGWDAGASKWQMQELLHTTLQFTAGGTDEDGSVLAVNCHCFYLEDKGPTANKPGSLWRLMPADKVPAGAEVARTVKK